LRAFLQLLITACIGLLSWWQLELYLGMSVVTIVMLAAGAAAAMLSWNSMREGYGLSMVVGLAYLVEIIWLAPNDGLHLLQPLMAWTVGLIGSGGWLLWETREKGPKRPAYERHPEY
jgi:hypothetical protein